MEPSNPIPVAAPVQTNTPQRGGGQHGGGQGGYNRGPRRDYPQEVKEFDERVVHVNRVARVVKGGRRFRFQVLMVLGDHKGQVGIGVAKGADVAAAVAKATDVAKKHLVKISMYHNTLTHEVQAKVGGSKILVMPAAPGTGLIAGGVVRTVLEVVGIENALSKSIGSNNKINTAYATVSALAQMEPAADWITTQHHKQVDSSRQKAVTAEKATSSSKEKKV